MERFTLSSSSDADDTDDVIICEPVGTGSVAVAGSGVIGGYSYFGDLPNPDSQDDSPRSREGDFAALFVYNARCSCKYNKAKNLPTFCDALVVEMDVLLGDSPSESILGIYTAFRSDLMRKGQWKLDSTALSIYNLSKFVHEGIKANKGLAPFDPQITALTVMYEYFDAKVCLTETLARDGCL